MKHLYLFFLILATWTVSAQTKRQEPAPYLPPLPKETTPTIVAPKGTTDNKGNPLSSATTQSVSPSNPNLSPTASPEAAQANYLQDIPVNLYTGTPLVKVPIYTLSEGGLAVSIGLNYNASGVRAHAVSGWTGLGWELDGLPTLSRIIRGLPDEGKLDFNTWNTFTPRYGFYTFPWIAGTTDNDHDKEPDIFLLNLGGTAYRFMFDGNQKAKFFPDADIKVEVVTANNPHLFNYYVKVFKQFKFTLPDGTQYLFTDENQEETAEVEVHYAQSNQVYPYSPYGYPAHFNHYLKCNSIPSAWYVKKITSPYSHEINFTYGKVLYSYYKLAENEGFNCSNLAVDKQLNRVFVQGSFISKIEGTNKVISFNDGNLTCTDYTDPETGETQQYCYVVGAGANREDIDSWTQNPTNSSASKILSNIAVYDKNATSDKLFWTFNYGYFVGTDNSGYDLPSGYSYSDVGVTHKKRLKLSQITVPDGNAYNFNYYGEANGFNFKTRFTYGIDHWGFINGYDGNIGGTGLIGKDYVVNNYCGSNREADLVFTSYGSLSKISSTTGSETYFTYEANQAKNYTNAVGGLRIKQLEVKDLIRGTDIVKKYDYSLASGDGSGFLFVKPNYHFTGNDGVLRSNSALYQSLLGESSRPIVGYSRVTESVFDASNNFLNKSISYFDQDETELSIDTQSYYCYWVYEDDGTGNYSWVYHCDPQTSYLPSSFTYQYDFRSGNPLKTESYNQNNALVGSNEMVYTASNGILNGQVYSRRVVKMNGQTYTKNYYFDFKKYRLEQQISKAYSPDGNGNVVTTTTDFTYKDEMPLAYRNTYQGKHNQVVKTASTDAYGYTTESYTKYVADFNFDSDSTYVQQTCEDVGQDGQPYYYDCSYYDITTYIPTSGTEARAIYELQQKGISSAVIESFSKKNNKVVASNYKTYYPDNSSYKTLPKSLYMLRTIPTTSFTEMTYNKVNQQLNKDANYGTERINFLSYNIKGLLQQSQVKRGSTTQTNYASDNLLVSSTTQNVGIADAMVTSYQYGQKFNAISKSIAPNATEIRYAYDNTGRVLNTKDQNNTLLNRYIYKGQSTTPISSITFDNNQRTKSCNDGQITLKVYVTGLVAGATAQFSTDGGTTWQNANIGNNGFSYTITPTNTYIFFQARASDNLSNVVSTQYHASCTGGINWSTNSCTASGSNSVFYVSVSGLATDSYAEFSIDGSTWYKANNGNNGYNVTVPYGTGGQQYFWARVAETPSINIFGNLNKCQ
jgi:hypothetical protein